MKEITFFQDENATITNSRAVLGNKTYALSNIASVNLFEKEPNNAPALMLFISGTLIFLFSLTQDNPIGCLSLGIILAVLGIVIIRTNKPEYIVKIASTSGEADALTSKDKEYIQKVVNAMNDAIVERG